MYFEENCVFFFDPELLILFCASISISLCSFYCIIIAKLRYYSFKITRREEGGGGGRWKFFLYSLIFLSPNVRISYFSSSLQRLTSVFCCRSKHIGHVLKFNELSHCGG